MGDNFLEAQAKNTRKRRAKAAAQVRVPRLDFRADRVVDKYTLECRDGYELQLGEELICLSNGNGAVEVIRGHEVVGKVSISGGGHSLAAEITSLGVGCVKVTSVDLIGGSAEIEVIWED